MAGEARQQLAALAPARFAAGTVLFTPGASPAGFVVVLDGDIRVVLDGAGGRSLMLYRVGAGDTCLETTLCLAGNQRYSATGVVERDLVAVVIPPRLFDSLMSESAAFRAYVFSRFGQRHAEMARVLESIAFARVDTRLASALIANCGADGVSRATHRALAEETGAAREVVSRQLAAFARDRLVLLARGRVTLLDRHRLQMLADLS